MRCEKRTILLKNNIADKCLDAKETEIMRWVWNDFPEILYLTSNVVQMSIRSCIDFYHPISGDYPSARPGFFINALVAFGHISP